MKYKPEVAGAILTLTSDFGTAGGYVGAMKGCLLSLAPHAAIHDISHDITPHAVSEGAWCLRRAAPRFPQGAVHLAVVDPGVGSGRAGLIIETERFLLVGPDNGLLTLAAQKGGFKRAIAIADSPPDWTRSTSFDGLTLFAPVAARLLLGDAPERFGGPVEGIVELPWPEPLREAGQVEGEVLLFDRFGNAITNITPRHLDASTPRHLDAPMSGRVQLASGESVRWCSHYGELAQAPDVVGALWNSDGHLELALYGDSLRDRRALVVGERVRLALNG
ncbi:MAG: SAM-dependent chlorinase/fluorinase [SAR324 cluster bacterium]|nr:SAM-dependent chlorinase/fluorinase [SAR324 cluster bacterium]MCZ6627202.1 SAM-dependent chlorinase/fluorinase [SAR324 cluster bacterium]MCZ6844094.1 SAM-dependent chlorinase/fluorinase [SAR324 cluster bacterium]